MTKKQKRQYQHVDKLKQVLNSLKGMKFRLDCGHHITFGHNLGNNIIIYNGQQLIIICTLCGY